ncbi:hypothetical protein [Azospirillum sp. TSO22-1]|uniref:hypothetical protein n=1 Tax=Azospirillum sp. TSO22-1 TaxID=716789 RepID=UPI000D614394|nr:hypothetical protein [Azospirillum sp. TSO22-1]PWC42090.1 hypothetical protein TSO221_22500 [Azospirillum sp. TSO22-1]
MRWPALRTTALAAALGAAALLLAGCQSAKSPADAQRQWRLYSVEQAGGGAGKRLIPFTTLDGYLAQTGGGLGSVARAITGASDLKPLVRNPVAVAAGEPGVFIVDEATQSLYRFRWLSDQAKDGLPGADFTHLRTLTELDEPTDLHLSQLGDLFVSDGNGKKVVQYDKDAEKVKVFKDEENLNRPVAVTTDKRGLRIFVADGLYDRVVAFNRAGVSLYGIGERGDGEGNFRNIRAMIQGPDGLLYVVDGISRHINVFGLDGSYIATFGKETFTDPGGIAVDDDGRVYVSDGFNHRILIFANRRLVETYGKPGQGPGEFQSPGNLAYHQGRLYVVDRQNARVQVFRVVPEEQARQRTAAGEVQ